MFKSETMTEAKIMMLTLQSLGYYAGIADYKEKKWVEEYGGYEKSVDVLLTNASKANVLKIFPAVWYDYDDEDGETNIDDNDYDFVSPIVEFYQSDWRFPKSVTEDENDKDLIGCHFFERSHGGGADYNRYVNIKCNQSPHYTDNEVICFYSHSNGKYKPFSNFYLSEMQMESYPFQYKELLQSRTFASGEHYFQFMKALEFDPNGEVLKQMCCNITCKEIKALGRKVENFDKKVWDIMSRVHMRDAISMKFWQNEELKELLLSTGDAILAEAAPRDTLWGIGLSESNPKAFDPAQWRGKNVLGNMLMYLRDEIREAEQQMVD